MAITSWCRLSLPQQTATWPLEIHDDWHRLLGWHSSKISQTLHCAAPVMVSPTRHPHHSSLILIIQHSSFSTHPSSLILHHSSFSTHPHHPSLILHPSHGFLIPPPAMNQCPIHAWSLHSIPLSSSYVCSPQRLALILIPYVCSLHGAECVAVV